MNKYVFLLPAVFCMLQCRYLDSDKTPAMYRRALYNDSIHNFAVALRIYDSILAIDPDNSGTLTRRGRSKFFLGDTVGALADVNKSIKIKRSAYSLRGRGIISMLQGHKYALYDLQDALKLSPGDELILGDLCHYFTKVAPDKDSALFYADAVMGLPDLDPESYTKTMNAYMHFNDYKKLPAVCDSVIKYFPDKAFAYNNKGFAQLKLGMTAEARENIQISLRIDATNSYAWKNMGLLCVSLHRLDSACLYFKKAQQLHYKEKYGNDVDSLIQQYCR